MVKGVADLRAQFAKVPIYVREEIEKVLSDEAEKLIREMRSLAPIPEIRAALRWTEGDVPAGALAIGTTRAGTVYGKMKVTIYVDAEDAWFAHFFEFGTAPRYQKSTGKYVGLIRDQPFFWPVWRSNKSRIMGRINRAVVRGMRRANKR